MAKYDIHDKKVFISGVSGGIGKQLALILTKDYGCAVFGVGRNTEKLGGLQSENSGIITYAADVSSKEGWENIARRLKELNFSPDIIINNAGIMHPFDSVLNLSDEEIDAVINTNFKSHIYSIRYLYDILIKSKEPAVINILSAAAALPLAGAGIYSASKRAALCFTEVLMQELGGVYTAAVLSGPVKTGLYNPRENSGETRAKTKEGIIAKIGVSAETEAKRIIKGVQRKKSRIVTGIIAKSMDKAYKKAPSFSVRAAGAAMRMLPLKTFRQVFKRRSGQKKD